MKHLIEDSKSIWKDKEPIMAKKPEKIENSYKIIHWNSYLTPNKQTNKIPGRLKT